MNIAARAVAALTLATVAAGEPTRRPFSADEFERLRQEIHTLPDRAAADSRFHEVIPAAVPPPRQSKIDHVVVLFMENRATDHIFGCMLGDRPDFDGIPSTGHRIPVDPNDKSKGTVAVQCGAADWVCDGGGGYSNWDAKFGPATSNPDPGTYPYSHQSDDYSVVNMGKGAADKALRAFNATQLPVKKAISDEFSVFNRYYTSVPSFSTPNHLFSQSATSCGIKDNIMYLLRGICIHNHFHIFLLICV